MTAADIRLRFGLMIAGLCLLGLTGCATSGGVTLPPLPAWRVPTDPSPVSWLTVQLDAAKQFPGVPVDTSDSFYTRVNRAWLTDYLAWTWDAARRAGIRYTQESFDCEDFADLTAVIAGLAASKAGVKAAPLMPRVSVQLPSGLHKLLGVVTDAGILIVEPQPDAGQFRIWPLAEYPHPVVAIGFGPRNK